MLALGLLLSVALPLLAGLAWMAPAPGRPAGSWAVALAYGYVVGLLITVAGMRLLDLAHVPIGFATAAAFPAAFAVLGFWRRRGAATGARAAVNAAMTTWRSLSRLPRILAIVLLMLIAARLLSVGTELLLRPAFPWEAVSSIAAKARVWFETGSLERFVSPASWLQGGGGHTDADPGAFALPSLLLLWTANAVGQWHEGAVGLPWWMLGVATTTAIYGYLRLAGGGLTFALAGAYLFVSLPLVDLNMLLAGAPYWVAAAGIGLCGCAMLAWFATPGRELAIHAVAGAALALASQLSTWPWFIVFAVATGMRQWPRMAGKLAVGIPLAVLLGVLVLLQTPVTLSGGTFQLQVASDWVESIESLFLLDNWHLLYPVLMIVALAGWRSILSVPWLPRTWTIAMGIGLMVLLGMLSMPGLWNGGLRDFSSVGLQLAPMVVVWVAHVARHMALNYAAGTVPEASQTSR